jgi:VIT1/CCC1 family predicted Fe2+/Mn2+ transporter
MANPRIQARVPDDLKEQIEEEAAETDKSQSEVARERIQESYDRDAADAASELADDLNQRYARPAPVAGLEEAAARANETAMYGSVLSLLSLALSALPSLVTLAPLIATVATVVSVTVAALGVLNIITAVIGTLYRAAKIVTAAGSSAPQSTN